MAVRGRSSSFVSGSCRTIRASRAIRRSGEARSGLMSSSLIQGCSTTSWLVRTQRLEDSGPFHHPPGECGCQRREGEGPVPVHLDQRAAGPEEQDGTELRVQAAADDQFVAVETDHLLDGCAAKVLGPVVLPYRGLHLLVGQSDLLCGLQVQAHAAHVCLVGYCLGVELEDRGVAEVVCQFHGLIRAARHLRLDGRDTVGGEDLLRLELGKDGTAGVTDVIYDLIYPSAVCAFLFGRLGCF